MIRRILSTFRWAYRNKKNFGKPILWIVVDYLKLRKNRRVSKLEYSNYRLYEADENFRNTFLSYEKASYYWKILNPREYACLARNKYLSNCLLKNVNIPIAELIAYYNPMLAVNGADYAYDYDSLVQILVKKGNTCFVVKPAEDSAHGQGVFVCYGMKFDENGDCVLELYAGKTIKLRDVLGNSPLLFESLIEQNSQMASFNLTSVNTMRIMTALYPDNRVDLIATFLKIGRHGSDVDNAGGGGNVDCAIDSETGKLFNTLQFNSWNDIVSVTEHPDSGTPLLNTYINGWEDVVTKLKDYQARIPFLKVIGWDVALTDNGPVIVEINNWWDTTGQLFIGRGWAPKVEDCYKAWENYYKNQK